MPPSINACLISSLVRPRGAVISPLLIGLFILPQMLIDDMAGFAYPVQPPLAFDVDVVAMWVDLRIAQFALSVVHSVILTFTKAQSRIHTQDRRQSPGSNADAVVMSIVV